MKGWLRRRVAMSSRTLALGAMSISRAATNRNSDASNLRPDSPTLLGQFPSSDQPPRTDHGDVPNLWFSFSQMHTARQVTVEDFPIAKSIAGVNMRLTADGFGALCREHRQRANALFGTINSAYYTDVLLTSWMAHTRMISWARHLKIDPFVLTRLAMQKQPVVPV
jgi:hypothetical protein